MALITQADSFPRTNVGRRQKSSVTGLVGQMKKAKAQHLLAESLRHRWQGVTAALLNGERYWEYRDRDLVTVSRRGGVVQVSYSRTLPHVRSTEDYILVLSQFDEKLTATMVVQDDARLVSYPLECTEPAMFVLDQLEQIKRSLLDDCLVPESDDSSLMCADEINSSEQKRRNRRVYKNSAPREIRAVHRSIINKTFQNNR